MAMMMARLYTGAHDIVTLRNAYHGLSGGCSHRPAAGCVPDVCAMRSAAKSYPAAGCAGSASLLHCKPHHRASQQPLPCSTMDTPLAEATMGLLGQHTWKYPVPQASGKRAGLGKEAESGGPRCGTHLRLSLCCSSFAAALHH